MKSFSAAFTKNMQALIANGSTVYPDRQLYGFCAGVYSSAKSLCEARLHRNLMQQAPRRLKLAGGLLHRWNEHQICLD